MATENPYTAPTAEYFARSYELPKRPLSLTILLILVTLLGISFFVQLGLGIRNVVLYSREATTLWELFLFFLTRIISAAFCVVLIFAHRRRIKAARWIGLGFMVLLFAYYVYFTLYVPVGQRAINLPRFQYNDPAFGLFVERLFGFCIMLYWTWHASFSEKAKLYFSSWLTPYEPQDLRKEPTLK